MDSDPICKVDGGGNYFLNSCYNIFEPVGSHFLHSHPEAMSMMYSPVQGVKEVTLLGQNVNSYRDLSQSSLPLSHGTCTHLSQGFNSIYHAKEGGRRFTDLLEQVSLVSTGVGGGGWRAEG